MDKQKMNLEQLYQERFQSFEMEPSSGANSAMKQKIRFAKTMQLIKWIAIAVIATATLATITYFSLTTENNPTSNNLLETPSNIETLVEEPNSKSPEISNTEINITNQVKENDSPSLIDRPTEETPLKQSVNQTEESLQPPTQEKREAEQSKETLPRREEKTSLKENQKTAELIFINNLAEEKVKETNKEPKTTPLELENNKYLSEDEIDLNYLNSKSQFIKTPEQKIDLIGKDLDLSPKNRFDSKTVKKKSGKVKSIGKMQLNDKPSHLSGYFDLHFSPLLWQNQANLASPDVDTNWSYNLNQQAQLSYELGFSFQIHHAKTPLFLQAGLDYQILKEKIDFQLSHTFEDPELSYWTYDSTFDYQQVIDTFYVIIDSNQFVIDTIFTQDTVLTNIDTTYFPVNSTEEKAKKHINTYTYLNIPLMLGYEFKSKNEQWRFQILAGAALAINLTNEGYYYTKTGNFESYSGKVKPSFVWNLQAAANISYRRKKWEAFAQPEIQYQLNESQYQDLIPRRKYQFYKVKLGIRFQLF